ncbi:probable E3 ubiquitin-protein ligase EDA40 [Aristolochia californica]|uniref:probable E3 ubiquitin-protein ligase EDA40 n=1 Tax=Aristolochia californica TaxID=171875 RepID=UPI0035D7EC03
MAGASSKLKKMARKFGLPCGSLSRTRSRDYREMENISTPVVSSQKENVKELAEEAESSSFAKNLCAICLEPLSSSPGASPGKAIFTAQCSHAFHFICISSNVRHGNVTCPICRAHWTQLPRSLMPTCSIPCHQSDPILRILDDSIATFRVHRRSSLRSARYDDDDPIEPDHSPGLPRLRLSLIPVPQTHPCSHSALHEIVCGQSPLSQFSTSSSYNSSPTDQQPYFCSNRAFVSVKLAQQKATDLVLVTSTNGPHLRLLKQSMALVVFSLRSVDRLSIVTYSSAATRAFPLRRMTSHGKRTALQVIDRLFYLGEADPSEGLKKGVKILQDRTHQNPHCCILHLSDSPTRAAYLGRDLQVPVPVHCFHVGFGFGTSNGFVMHEFEEFLARLLGGVIRETQLRIGEEGWARLGELRGGEERRIPLDLGDCGYVCVGYTYIECGPEERLTTGEIIVGLGDKGERSDERGDVRDSSIGGRNSNVERWEYHDPYMARRWAKHLHGYRL